jgi:hypothetical protein
MIGIDVAPALEPATSSIEGRRLKPAHVFE